MGANIWDAMRRILSLVFAVLLSGTMTQTASAQAPAPLDLVKWAIEAMGGVDALRRN